MATVTDAGVTLGTTGRRETGTVGPAGGGREVGLEREATETGRDSLLPHSSFIVM